MARTAADATTVVPDIFDESFANDIYENSDQLAGTVQRCRGGATSQPGG